MNEIIKQQKMKMIEAWLAFDQAIEEWRFEDNNCPSDKELVDYCNLKVDQEQEFKIKEHVQDCVLCQEHLRTLYEEFESSMQIKSLMASEFQARFSDVLKDIQAGQPIAIIDSTQRTTLAVLVPYDQYMKVNGRRLGVLQEKANYQIHHDFEITDEDFLKS